MSAWDSCYTTDDVMELEPSKGFLHCFCPRHHRADQTTLPAFSLFRMSRCPIGEARSLSILEVPRRLHSGGYLSLGVADSANLAHSSPVWVLMYWRDTLSTSHVHNTELVTSRELSRTLVPGTARLTVV
jgi:hypothetical protein